jgi:predicted N-formylglutamate amidohydrolase
MTTQLLGADEPSPVLLQRRDGVSDFVIAVDHAGRRIPRALGSLGLPTAELERHIAWDIGALEVAKQVSETLDAPLVAQNYSRLVIDCNRRPGDPTSIPIVSEHTDIPGNANLSDADKEARRREIFEPYHACLRDLLDARERAGRRTVLISQHSMTNVFKGIARQMHAAVLFDEDPSFARCLRQALGTDAALEVAENEPYSGKTKTGFTQWHHGQQRAIAHVEVEIRQDLVASAAGQIEWSCRIAAALTAADELFRGRGKAGAAGLD